MRILGSILDEFGGKSIAGPPALLLLPLLVAAEGCSEAPIGTDAAGVGGMGSTSSTGGVGGTSSAGGAGGMSSTGGVGGTSSAGGAGGMSSTGGAGGMSSTGGAGGTGGTMVCQPGTMVACYSGPPGTQGVGECKAGTQTCNPDGMAYGACIGQVLPVAEVCDPAMKDENCDGHPGCQCGDGTLDPGESCDDGNTQNGDACPADCLRPIVAIDTGGASVCALLADSRLKCWGANSSGELGQGDTMHRGDNPGEMGDNLPPVDLGTGKTVVTFATGDFHVCAILNDGTVKCWGNNQFASQLGLGDTANRGDNPGEMGDNLPRVNLGTGKTAVAIAAGAHHTCAILNDGSVKCWGHNGFGQLGLGDVNHRGNQPSEMGDNLPVVNLGTGKTAVKLFPGTWHTCALLNDGSLKCWGNNNNGNLGLGDTPFRGDGPNEMGDNLPAVDLGSGKTIVAVAAGMHTCAIMNDGSLKCWGWNDDGRLGLGDTLERGDEPNEMGDNLPAVDLGTGRKVVAIDVDEFHSCALLDNGSVKCWGPNGWGQLGLGDVSHRGDQPNEMGDSLPVVDLGSTTNGSALIFNCALFTGGRVKCWGNNVNGALGLGDSNTRGDNPGEMGDNLPFLAP